MSDPIHKAAAPLSMPAAALRDKLPTTAPKPSQQKLLGLDVTQLKSLKEVSLDFSCAALTAIMGTNCSGKTTILHALACAHNPPDESAPDYYFPQFFRPNTDALWQGSDFTIRYSERRGPNEFLNLKQRYTKINDRWSPRYVRRPERYTRFVSIGESVPDVETLNLISMIHYERVIHDDEVGEMVGEAAGQVLNKSYDTLYKVTYNYSGKVSIGVKTAQATYSGLSMSSGEQRVFRILDAVLRARNYGLILVDEIDLFLHQDALQRLLSKLQEHCTQKNKQLVFTTHFPPVAQMYDKMCIFTINRTPVKTVVWRGYSYEAMRHITGHDERPVHCYVEDDVAEAIVAQITCELGIRKFVQFGKYGPARNAFSLCAGLQLSAAKTEHTIAVLDGDVYGNWRKRHELVKEVCTGDQPFHQQQRKALMKLVRTLTPVKNRLGQLMSPEQKIHRMLHDLDPTLVTNERKDLHEIAMNVINVPDRHGFVNEIIRQTGESRQVALSKIIELASHSAEWRRYTRLVRLWLLKQKQTLAL